MNDLTTFTNPEFGQVRTVEIDGTPWLVGKDVAVALGYKNPQRAIRDHVDAEDKGVTKTVTPSGEQEMLIINESGLYSLILSSKMPKAKAFKRWVTSEVLPAIRKNGAYESFQAQQHIEQLEATNTRLNAASRAGRRHQSAQRLHQAPRQLQSPVYAGQDRLRQDLRQSAAGGRPCGQGTSRS